MGPSPISASLGAMVSLPRKLDELLATKHRALRGIVMDGIEQLTAHLRVLHSFMLKLSNAQDPPTSARYWIKDVRELSYDMEDFADQFVQAHGRAKIYFLKRRHHAHGRAKIRRATFRKLIFRMKDMCELSYEIEEFIDQFIHALGRAKIRRATCRKLISRLKIGRLSDRRNWRPWITNMISEFRTRAQDASRRYRRYKLDDCVLSPGYSPIVHELPTILQDLGDLVGIEGPVNELERWLINNGEEQLKVVSIVGVGGIGKTTLAQKLWAKLNVQFECGAFVRTAQKPDMRGILRNILLQVRPHEPPNAGEMRHLINDLREYLQGKRYLIIIDDLWSTSVWDVVSRAFPQSDCCSRIITMTEIMEVALACCCFFPEHIFKMESLGDNDSQKLLLQRILVSGNQSPQQFDDIIPQIVRSCGGLPLAIIILARILAIQPEKLKQWGSTHNSFDSIFGVNSTMEGFMGQILNICFISLPYYLKTCLLYLSTFPEGYLFLKDDLVKQWVAEGFICANEGEDMEEVARRYFDELVSMGLIQVMDMNCNYEMFSYSVHQLILDLIKYKSIEENFITVMDYSQTTIPLNDKVRRLALHFGSATYATTPTSSRLSQVRSLFFSGLFNCMPSFVVFKLLRVLILHVWDDTGTTELNLTGICELLQLRYLQVTCNVVVKLPDRIAEMKHLETLEINTRECDVPSDIVRLSSLLHLRLQGANLPSGIGGIRSLHTLMYFDLGNSSEDSLRGLGELINLQDLHLTYSSSPSSEHLKRNLIALAASVRKLCNLKYLTLAPGGTAAARVILFDGSSDMSMPMFLERLELLAPICILSRLPKWIGQLRKICILKVAVSELPTIDIAILTGLPSLTVLWLSVQTAPEGRTVFNNYAFPVLKYFKFSCGVLCMSFMAGAMPDLRRLKLVFNTHTGEAYDNMLAGIEHLLKLQDIAVQIGVTTGSDWRAAESVINEAIDKHPRSPGRNFQCVDPVAEEFRPSGKHHWSNEKSSLDEKPQDTVVQIGATTGSDWRTAESAINEAVDKHPRSPRRNFECVDPAAEEFRPSKKQQKSSLDEKLQDTVVQIGATTGSDWRAAESAINEDIAKHPRFLRRTLQCVDPVVKELRPSKKHHWSNEKSSLDEQLGVLKKSNDMKKLAGSGPSQLLNLPSTVASGCQESGSSVEESKESPAPSLQVQEKKRMKRSLSSSTVIREAMIMKQVQNVFTVLEPLVRRAVQEEIQVGLVHNPRRSSPETPPAADRPAWRLVFLCPPAQPIFTGSKIKDVNGEPLQVILVHTYTGLPCGVLPDFMRVELVPLFGDFPPGGREEWTAGEFALGIVKERAGKRQLLTGDIDLTMRDGRAVVNELQFTDNSWWIRCRKFRIGARVVPGSYEGARVAEAMTDAFNVRDHLAKHAVYRKHYPPVLGDEVWRLEMIEKDGAFHRKLLLHGVETVQEFLRVLMVKPDVLREIMGDGMTDGMWEACTSHAKTCDAGDKVYGYTGQHGATIYVNSICQLVKIEFAGLECASQQLNRAQKAYVHQLHMEAFEQREKLQEAEPATMLLHAGSSSSSSRPVLQNAAPVAPPPHPATPISFEGDPSFETRTQLIGQATGLIFKIIRAAEVARQNKQECNLLARRVPTIKGVLSKLPEDPEVAPPLEEMKNTLQKAHDMVVACRDWGAARRFFGSRRQAECFTQVNARISSDVGILNLCLSSYMARRHSSQVVPHPSHHKSVPTATIATAPWPGFSSGSLHTQVVVPQWQSQVSSISSDNPRALTWLEIAAATSFTVELGRGSSGRVYMGRLQFHHGQDVAVKVLEKHGRQSVEDAFMAESNILSGLRHDHIVRLIGWCAEQEYRMLVYEHLGEGMLRDHLQYLGKGMLRDHLQHLGGGPSCSSPVRTSWRTRVEVLLGVARAIDYLHRGADPLVIHRNVSSSNILLDDNLTPRLAGFGSAVFQAAGQEHSGQLVEEVVGTPGYVDPEYSRTKRVSTASDVYSFGVVMLEALTGMPRDVYGVTLGLLMEDALQSIHSGRLREVLDGRPAPRPTPRQLEALHLVAETASRCLSPHGQNRLAMSEVVANLERALEIICSNEPMSWASII